MSRILVDQVRSNSASGDAITLDGSGKCAINATTINSLTFPTSDGSADQIIKTNGSGALAFASIPAGGAAAGNMFRAKMSGGYNTSNNTQGEIVFQSEDFDLGGAYNHTNGRFTPNITGYYHIDASLQFSNAQSNYNFRSSIYKNNSEYAFNNMWNDGSNGENNCRIASIVYANGSSDYISIFGWQNSGGGITINAGNGSYFNAFFLRTS